MSEAEFLKELREDFVSDRGNLPALILEVSERAETLFHATH